MKKASDKKIHRRQLIVRREARFRNDYAAMKISGSLERNQSDTHSASPRENGVDSHDFDEAIGRCRTGIVGVVKTHQELHIQADGIVK